MATIQTLLELDAVLEPFRTSAFKDKDSAYVGYRNHCQRVANAALINLSALGTPVTSRARRLVAVAAAFHDLGIWTRGTWDYLDPSEEDAREFMAQRSPEFPKEDEDLVVRMIEEHHKIFPFKTTDGQDAAAEQLRFVEAFRRADWVDVSFGILLGALSRGQYKELNKQFPVAGFFGMLVGICISSWLKRPFSNPLPMMRW